MSLGAVKMNRDHINPLGDRGALRLRIGPALSSQNRYRALHRISLFASAAAWANLFDTTRFPTDLTALSILTGAPAYAKPLRHASLGDTHGDHGASPTTVTHLPA